MAMSRTASLLNQSLVRTEPRRSCAGRFPTIIVSEDAVCGDIQLGWQALLNRISQAARSNNPRQAIAEVLHTQTVEPALAQAEIFLEGTHHIGDTIAVAAGTARVEAAGCGMLLGVGKARLRARGFFQVWVTDDVYLDAYDNVRVDAGGNAHVKAYNNVIGVARERSHGTVHGAKATWTVLGENCFFDIQDGCTTYVQGGEVRAYGRTQVHASGKARVSLYGNANGWLRGEVEAELAGSSIAYTAPTVRYRLAGTARRLPLAACAG